MQSLYGFPPLNRWGQEFPSPRKNCDRAENSSVQPNSAYLPLRSFLSFATSFAIHPTIESDGFNHSTLDVRLQPRIGSCCNVLLSRSLVIKSASTSTSLCGPSTSGCLCDSDRSSCISVGSCATTSWLFL